MKAESSVSTSGASCGQCCRRAKHADAANIVSAAGFSMLVVIVWNIYKVGFYVMSPPSVTKEMKHSLLSLHFFLVAKVAQSWVEDNNCVHLLHVPRLVPALSKGSLCCWEGCGWGSYNQLFPVWSSWPCPREVQPRDIWAILTSTT